MNEARAPGREDRIAVVGGGAAGLHAAWVLQERGYTRVQVYERQGRIGGKSATVHRGGVPHELGTCYLHPGYAEIKRLLARTGATVEVKPGGRDGRRDIYSRRLTGRADRPLDLGEWMLGAIEQATMPKVLWWAPDGLQAGQLLLAVERYKNLHRRIFGDYTGSLPPRPAPEEREQIDQTMGQFLEAHRLQALAPLITLSSGAMGYGLLDTVPALYGMWWNTPDLLDAFLASGRDPDAPVLTMLADGYGALWEALAAGVQVQCATEVEQVRRTAEGVRLAGTRDGQPWQVEADWLVLATDLQRALAWLDADEGERALFEGMQSVTLVTHLVRVDPRHTACITYWPDRLRAGLDGRVYSVRDSRKCLLPDAPREDPEDLLVTYQYLDRPVLPLRAGWLERQMVEDLRAAGYTGVQVLEQRIWPYFTRFTQDGINRGHPWELFARQGRRRTWYLGGSACFESVHDISTYTLQVLDAVSAGEPPGPPG